MQVRVLGATEVYRTGEVIDLGSRKQRAVLAALALYAGRPVAVDTLVAVIWGDEPPAAVTTSLQVYVAGLRRALEPDRPARTPPSLLVTAAPGYRLALGPGQLDAAVFDAAVESAHRRLGALSRHLPWLFGGTGTTAEEGEIDAGELEEISASLGAAERSWRGVPYLDLGEAAVAVAERTRLEQLRLLALEDAAMARLALGEEATVAAELEPLIREHPLRENLAGLRALALARCGYQADALDALRAIRRRLTDDLGIDPHLGIRELETAVLRQDPALGWRASAWVAAAARPPAPQEPEPVPPAPVEPRTRPRWPLVGRSAELATLAALLPPSTAGEPQFAVLVGEPGIGKSRLTQELIGAAERDGFTVLIGRCSEDEGAPPLWPWVGVLRALVDTVPALPVPAADDLAGLAGLLQLGPGLAGSGPASGPDTPAGAGGPGDWDAARFRIWDAVARVLTAAADQRPLLVVLEDLHWADASSLRLLRHLAETLDRARIAVVATRRPHPEPTGALGEATEALVRRHAVRIDLGALTTAETAELVAAATGEVPDPLVAERMRGRTDGNPFFLVELARLLAGRFGSETLDGAAIPAAVTDVVLRRVERLPVPTQQLLRTAAVIGRRFDLSLLAAATGRDDEAVLDDLDPAMAAGLVGEEAVDEFYFSHALAREAVYANLPAARRARRHAAVAAALRDDPALSGRSSETAWHLLAAGPALAGQAWRAAFAAAEQARARYAHEEAAELLAAAITAQRRDREASGLDRYDLLMARVAACRAAADRDGLDEALEAAIGEAESLGDIERMARAAVGTAEGALWTSRPYGVVAARVVDTLRRVLRDLPPGDSELRCRALLVLAGELYYAEGPDYREALADEGLAMARRLGDARLLIWACQTAFVAIWRPATAHRRLSLADEAVGLCVDHAEAGWEAYARTLRATVRGELGDVAGMWADVDVGRGLADALRLRYPLVVLAWTEVAWLAMRGESGRAEELLNQTMELARGTSLPQHETSAAGAAMCVRLWEDRPGDAFALLEGVAAVGTPLPLAGAVQLVLVRAGRLDEARAAFARDGLPLGSDDWLSMLLMGMAAEVSFALGMRDVAEEVYQRLAPYAGRVCSAGSVSAIGPVDAFLATAAAAAGDRERATGHADDAMALCEKWEIPLVARWLAEQRERGDF